MADGRAIGGALVPVSTLYKFIPSAASVGEKESTARPEIPIYEFGGTNRRTSHAGCPDEPAAGEKYISAFF